MNKPKKINGLQQMQAGKLTHAQRQERDDKIRKTLKDFDITNFQIAMEGWIDTTGSIDLVGLIKDGVIPVQFNVVGGSFLIQRNKLKSLKGCPRLVGKNFDCRDNNLPSLEGGPGVVGETYDCSFNFLKDLRGIAKSFKVLKCSNNDLESLEGLELLRSLDNIHIHYNGNPDLWKWVVNTNYDLEVIKLLFWYPSARLFMQSCPAPVQKGIRYAAKRLKYDEPGGGIDAVIQRINANGRRDDA